MHAAGVSRWQDPWQAGRNAPRQVHSKTGGSGTQQEPTAGRAAEAGGSRQKKRRQCNGRQRKKCSRGRAGGSNRQVRNRTYVTCRQAGSEAVAGGRNSIDRRIPEW